MKLKEEKADLEAQEENKEEENMKYVVINVYDREIMKVGVAESPTEATEIMKNDFMQIFEEHYETDDFENEVGRGDEWDFNETEAWFNVDDDPYNYDWRIIEID